MHYIISLLLARGDETENQADCRDGDTVIHIPKIGMWSIILYVITNTLHCTCTSCFLALLVYPSVLYHYYHQRNVQCNVQCHDSLYFTLIGDQPQLHELQLLEDVDGRTIRVMERVATDWKHLAISLKFNSSKIKIIEKDYKTSTEEACKEMFMRWLAGEHDLAQPCTWDTLIKCLRRAAFTDVADSLTTIILRQQN